MFDRIKLRRDLTDCGGRLLARAGTVISVEGIWQVAHAARPGSGTPLGDTFIADDLADALAEPAHRFLFRTAETRSAVRKVVETAELPMALVEEMAAAKLTDAPRYRHALASTAITARMILSAAGAARATPRLAVAGLLHDIGMAHVSVRVTRAPDSLRGEDVLDVVQHPLLGAFQLARLLGDHPAVEAALAHHWRDGQGYPDLPTRPSPSTDVVAVASAFAALTQGRAWRSDPYDARGAADVLVAEASSGHADPFAVKLLVHALRGGEGSVTTVRFGKARPGTTPVVNRHTRVAPPTRFMA